VSPEERDDLDRALAAGLGALVPDVDGADATLEALRPRMRRARTRRRVARVSSVAVALVLLGAVAAFAAPHDYFRSHVSVASHEHGGPGPQPPHAKTTTSIARVVVPPHVTSTTVAPAPGVSTTTITVPLFVPPAGGVTPTTIDATRNPSGNTGNDHGGNGGGDQGGPGGSGGESTTTTPPTTVPTGDQTFNSAGGGVTVNFDGSALTLVGYHAAAGYTSRVDSQQPDDIEVRFVNGEKTWGIQVQVENGHVIHQIFSDD